MKYISWAIVVLLGLLLAGVVGIYQIRIVAKDAEIAALKKQFTKLVNEANEKLEHANQPEVPISIAFRKGLVDSGLVAQLRNNSGSTAAITIEVKRPSGQAKSLEEVIDSNETKEIGESEGWAFIAGDSLTLKQSGHKSKSYTVR